MSKTVGVFGIKFGKTKIDVHAGFNRLEDGFQFQEVVVPAEDLGPVTLCTWIGSGLLCQPVASIIWNIKLHFRQVHSLFRVSSYW